MHHAPAVSSTGPTLEQTRGMRAAIVMQCFGALAMQVFGNGLMLLYLQSLGASESLIAMAVSLPNLVLAVAVLPLSYLADRWGRKRLGLHGVLAAAVGFAVLTAGSAPGGTVGLGMVMLGVVIYALGWSGMTASWWSMLEPIVPADRRGRFFGIMRFWFQLVGLVFALLAAMWIAGSPDERGLRWVMGVITLALFARAALYAWRFPELGHVPVTQGGTIRVIRQMMGHAGFIGFAGYTTGWRFLSSGALLMAALLLAAELADRTQWLIWLMSLATVGSLLGQFLGGRLTDALATARILVAGHGLQVIAIAALAMRPAHGSMLLACAALLVLGFASAAGSVALTVRQYAVIPPTERSLSTSTLGSLQTAGASAAGFAIAWMLQGQGIWHTLGWAMDAADGRRVILGLFGIGTLLLTLVPMHQMWSKRERS